jgi:hypothetical protein
MQDKIEKITQHARNHARTHTHIPAHLHPHTLAHAYIRTRTHTHRPRARTHVWKPPQWPWGPALTWSLISLSLPVSLPLARARAVALGAGADVALDAADIVLVQNKLEHVLTALDLSKSIVARIWMNYVRVCVWLCMCA